MSLRVVALISDSGDGTSTLEWFTNIEKAEGCLNDDDLCQYFSANDGSFAADLSFPDGTDLLACGIYVWAENT